MRWRLQPNPLSRLLDQKRASGAPVLDLAESNPTRAGLRYPEQTILNALSSPGALAYDPHPAGLMRAREAVSAYYDGAVTPDRILLTASTSEAYGFLFKLLADPGDEVLVPRPSYPLFEFLAELESVRVVQYPLVYDHGWMIDFHALLEVVSPRTRAIVVVNPNNPTGSYLKSGEFQQLMQIGLPVIADEVFIDYSFGEPYPRAQCTFTVSGLSKISGLPQMKLGWVVVSESEAYSRLELIADTYLSVSTPIQCAAPALLDVRHTIQAQIRERTAANLAWLRGRVRGSAFSLLEVEGGWYAALQAPRTRTEEEWVLQALGELDVLIQPGFFYDFDREAFLVLSLLTPEPAFREGTERLLALP